MICRPRKSDSHPRRSSVHIVTVRHTAHAAVLVLAVKENLFPLLPSGSRGSPLIKILTNVLIFCQMSDILNRPCREVVGPYGQRYRSGHNGADSKSVWEQSHEGSNPSRCATSSEQSPLCSDDFLSKSSSAPLPCSSSPNRTRCAGLRFGFSPRPERGSVLTVLSTTSRQSPLCSDDFLSKSSSAPLPCSSSPNRTRCAGLRFGFEADRRSSRERSSSGAGGPCNYSPFTTKLGLCPAANSWTERHILACALRNEPPVMPPR